MNAVAQYRRMFTAHGQRVTIERQVVNAPAETLSDVRARLRGASAEEIASGVTASERIVMILAEDIPQAWRPLKTNDRIRLSDGTRLSITERPDDQTHRNGETLLAYICRAS